MHVCYVIPLLQEGRGTWVALDCNSGPTGHKLLIDTRFELPSGEHYDWMMKVIMIVAVLVMILMIVMMIIIIIMMMMKMILIIMVIMMY